MRPIFRFSRQVILLLTSTMKFCVCCILIILVAFIAGCHDRDSSSKDQSVSSAAEQEIIARAIIEFDAKHGANHTGYNIKTLEEADEWVIYFDAKTQIIGDHAVVTIEKETGGIQYYPGE